MTLLIRFRVTIAPGMNRPDGMGNPGKHSSCGSHFENRRRQPASSNPTYLLGWCGCTPQCRNPRRTRIKTPQSTTRSRTSGAPERYGSLSGYMWWCSWRHSIISGGFFWWPWRNYTAPSTRFDKWPTRSGQSPTIAHRFRQLTITRRYPGNSQADYFWGETDSPTKENKRRQTDCYRVRMAKARC